MMSLVLRICFAPSLVAQVTTASSGPDNASVGLLIGLPSKTYLMTMLLEGAATPSSRDHLSPGVTILLGLLRGYAVPSFGTHQMRFRFTPANRVRGSYTKQPCPAGLLLTRNSRPPTPSLFGWTFMMTKALAFPWNKASSRVWASSELAFFRYFVRLSATPGIAATIMISKKNAGIIFFSLP